MGSLRFLDLDTTSKRHAITVEGAILAQDGQIAESGRDAPFG